ncbi:helix-turn-helix transcriptional regulator [Burkholderia sp. 22PA0099]|uniref:helix-turn-helix transcriptional regulator n=1 Tax=Burkholderia sp. 22PA0099 TaxID=3237372 RepID=UPI0039C17C80
MAVQALSSPADSAPIPISFQTLGRVIDSVGTPEFVPRLTVLLNEIVPVNVVHIERSRTDSAMPSGFRAEWVGSGGVGMDTSTIADVMTLYYDRFYDRDPLFAGIRGEVGTLLVVRDVGAIPPGEFRQRLYDEVQIAHECVLARGTRHAQHSIALERDTRQPAFSLAEMQRFRTVSDCLFPLLELHASTTAARRIAHFTPHLHPLAQFDARIARDGLRLSKREYEICAHLIGGKTVPEAADILSVRVATAESYVKRAFAKLGVRTKRELVTWGQLER